MIVDEDIDTLDEDIETLSNACDCLIDSLTRVLDAIKEGKHEDARYIMKIYDSNKDDVDFAYDKVEAVFNRISAAYTEDENKLKKWTEV